MSEIKSSKAIENWFNQNSKTYNWFWGWFYEKGQQQAAGRASDRDGSAYHVQLGFDLANSVTSWSDVFSAYDGDGSIYYFIAENEAEIISKLDSALTIGIENRDPWRTRCTTCNKTLQLEPIPGEESEFRLVTGKFRCKDNLPFCDEHIDAATNRQEDSSGE